VVFNKFNTETLELRIWQGVARCK